MKKSKLFLCLLCLSFCLMLPVNAYAKSKFSFSFNFDAFNCLTPPPPPVIEKHVYVSPLPPTLPPPYLHEQWVVHEYAYPSFSPYFPPYPCYPY